MITFVIVFSLILELAFIAITRIVDGAKTRDDLNRLQIICVYIFAAIDVLHNYTAGAILFWEFAHPARKTLSMRLRHILHSGLYAKDSRRFKLALFVCKYMIEPWAFGHCGLGRV